MNQAPHVLLVEDDADFAYLNRCRLEEYGLTTEVCPTLHGALERLDARTGRSFDVVLLDLRLPDTDGLEGVMALRAATDLPIVMLTSTSGTDVAIEAVRLGVDDYLDKAQADADRLVRSLRFAVERRAPGPDGGRPPGSGPVREIPEMFEPVLGDLGRFLGMETMAFHHPDGSGTVWVHRHETSPWLQPREVVRYLEVTIDAVAAGDAPRLAGDAQRRLRGVPRLGSYVAAPVPVPVAGRSRPGAYLCGLSPDLVDSAHLVERHPALEIAAGLLGSVIHLDRRVAGEARRRMVAEGMRTGRLLHTDPAP